MSNVNVFLKLEPIIATGMAGSIIVMVASTLYV